MVDSILEDRVADDDLLDDITISSLKRPVFYTIDNDEIVDFIHYHCKKLLEFSKSKNQSREVAKCINLENFEVSGTVPGTSNNVEINSIVNVIENSTDFFLVIHNHPSDTSFSYRDLNTFVRTKNMAILMVVGNHGSIYIVEKSQPIFSKGIVSLKKTILDCKNGIIDYNSMIEQMREFGIVYTKM